MIVCKATNEKHVWRSARVLQSRPSRHGISLLEVMFAVGVIAVGLLGVAVLLSVSGKLAADGRTTEDGARAGMNWVREFELRGYAQPGAWVIANGSASGTAAYVDDAFGLAVGKSFCIDPRSCRNARRAAPALRRSTGRCRILN